MSNHLLNVDLLDQEEYLALARICRRMQTQNNASTSHPMFVLYDKIRVPTTEEYEDGYFYKNDDGDEFTIEEMRANYLDHMGLTEQEAEDEDTSEDDMADELALEKVHYQSVDQFREIFFTREEAEAEIENCGYRYYEPFIYVASMYNNSEMRLVQSVLLRFLKPLLPEYAQ